MSLHSEICWEGCPTNCQKSLKSALRIPGHLLTLIFIIYGLLKMSSGSTVLDPDPELMNAQNFNFAKPKLSFKNIGRYAATSTYIHVRIPFNFTTVFNMRQAIAEVYNKLLDQHEEPFKSITKSITDVSLAFMEGSLEDLYYHSPTTKIRNFNARQTELIHCHWNLHHGQDHVHLQHCLDHPT
jgi:hypothetical protein